MKFLRYCYQIDIDFSNPGCRTFGNGEVAGHVIGNKVYLYIHGFPNLLCEFFNDENAELSDKYLIDWATNTSLFIQDTIGIMFNPNLNIDIPTIIQNMKYYGNGKIYNPDDRCLDDVDCRPMLALKHDRDSYFITVDGKPIYEEGISNESVAKRIFDKFVADIRMYIKKRWHINDNSSCL